ncbi:MAG: outer membrane protein [Beijerinckiaceae bacterium]
MRSLFNARTFGLAAVAVVGLVPVSALAQNGPAPNWTGVYAGAHAGVGAGSIRGGSATGGLVGGQVGFNAQADRVVLGVEGDMTSSSFEHKGLNGGGQTFRQKWVGTVRGRAGYAFDQVLVYGTVGGAAANNTVSDFGGKSDKKVLGWVAGAGAEVKLTDRISARGEVLHYALGTGTYTTPVATYRLDSRTNVVRAGVSYRF